MQPYSPQGAYPPQPPTPPAPKSKSPWVVGLFVFVVLAAVGVGAVLLLSGDDDSSTSTDESGSDGEEQTPDGGASAAGAATSLTGTWEGTYECGNGPAGLTLTMDDSGDGTLGANFAYQPSDETPDADTGRYSMEGTVAEGQLSLEGATWIDPEDGSTSHPMAGIEADLSSRANSEHLEGTLVGEGCTSFAVDRVSTDPWYAGVWEGGYGCSQGLTALTLTVEPGPDDTATATFEFYEHPDNPGVPSGSFAMEGDYQDRTLSLQGVEWIEQPSNYAMVDLQFHSERGIDPQRMYGEVVGAPPSCSIFELLRPEE